VTEYVLEPVGLDAWDSRVRPFAGQRVVKVQPRGCPRNGTMGHCYVETVDGDFVGLVLVNSLRRAR
jgi:hypothetical protein